MIAAVKSWLLGLVGAAVFCALASELTPAGPVKRVQKIVCALVLAAALLLPLLRLDPEDYALNAAQYRSNAALVTGDAQEAARRMERTYIEDELEAYILDKAARLGAEVGAVRVTLRWSTEGCWYPVAAELDAPYHARLSEAIAGELGIPREKQTWRDG